MVVFFTILQALIGIVVCLVISDCLCVSWLNYSVWLPWTRSRKYVCNLIYTFGDLSYTERHYCATFNARDSACLGYWLLVPREHWTRRLASQRVVSAAVANLLLPFVVIVVTTNVAVSVRCLFFTVFLEVKWTPVFSLTLFHLQCVLCLTGLPCFSLRCCFLNFAFCCWFCCCWCFEFVVSWNEKLVFMPLHRSGTTDIMFLGVHVVCDSVMLSPL